MLPSDFSPEKQARERFLKREADLRKPLHEAKVKVSTTTPIWIVEVQFENADYERDASDDPKSMADLRARDPRTLVDSLVDSFMRSVAQSRLEAEERVRENRIFVKVPARTGREAEKVVKVLLVKAIRTRQTGR